MWYKEIEALYAEVVFFFFYCNVTTQRLKKSVHHLLKESVAIGWNIFIQVKSLESHHAQNNDNNQMLCASRNI